MTVTDYLAYATDATVATGATVIDIFASDCIILPTHQMQQLQRVQQEYICKQLYPTQRMQQLQQVEQYNIFANDCIYLAYTQRMQQMQWVQQ